MAIKNLLSSPVFVGAATASVTWVLFEMFGDPLKRIFKKKKGGGKKRKVKMVRNKFGEVYPYYDDYSDEDYAEDYGEDYAEDYEDYAEDYGESYFGGWERQGY